MTLRFMDLELEAYDVVSLTLYSSIKISTRTQLKCQKILRIQKEIKWNSTKLGTQLKYQKHLEYNRSGELKVSELIYILHLSQRMQIGDLKSLS